MQTSEDQGPLTVTDGEDGPEALFTNAYRAYSGPVRGYLAARGVDDPDAVTNDVFLTLYSRMTPPEGSAVPAFRGGLAGAKSLAFTIAHGRAVDHHRHRARTPFLVPHEQETDPRRAPGTPEETVLAGQGAQELLDHLPEDHREVLLLRIVADLSIEQTAAIMERSQGAVKQLQRRALKDLKAHVSSRKSMP
ncbi:MULTISPECIES: sigma-70 family RNA polymerase sigma factor [Arthrobacter]|uniref:Sigma-70 family RNA polymerase sigma factor n=2 Tax=Arthrobacter TaxID=1663 RepID=A0ABU9KIU8_9MICC|nr:sigma-70 family RNA polymerase sigma factor [Arthrobacter sp. YJM1]MDP5226938.1 sigma-70 family RNA polymerase sigma factor [Arthrobacter sp. YJM1]